MRVNNSLTSAPMRKELAALIQQARKIPEELSSIDAPNCSESVKREIGASMIRRRTKEYKHFCGMRGFLSPRELLAEEEHFREILGVPAGADVNTWVTVEQAEDFEGYTEDCNVIYIEWSETDGDYFERLGDYMNGGLETARIMNITRTMLNKMHRLADNFLHTREVLNIASDMIYFLGHANNHDLNPEWLQKKISEYETKYGITND